MAECEVGHDFPYNRHEEKKNRLVLSVFVRELEFTDEEVENAKTNQIFLDGYICKPPVYRKTPLGREIADILLAVNRPYGKSDYIPCIAECHSCQAGCMMHMLSCIQVIRSLIGF